MPRVGPGDDNVTGDRYTLDLGVEPDLGNLLQNLQVANSLLDEAEDKFRSIADVVTSTTQKIAAMTRQTQLLGAEARNAGNAYQNIASSGFALANAGAMASGVPMGMMPYGMIPGQQALSGMPPAAEIASMGSGVPQNFDEVQDEENMRPAPVKPPDLRLLQLNAVEEMMNRFGGSHGARAGKKPSWFQRAKAGYKAKGSLWHPGETWETGNELIVAGKESFAGPAEALAAGAPEEAVAIGEAGAAGGIGAIAGAAAPYAAALYGAYRLYAGQTAAARRYAGITGDTDISRGVAGGGAVELGLRARWMGLLHPGVDYGRVQEEAMSTGAIGDQYYQTRDFLFEASKRGMSDIIDMVDLYQEAVGKAGASNSQLVGSLDSLRKSASTTNASLGALSRNFQADVETMIDLGAGGGSALFAALSNTNAYANQSGIGRMNPSLLNSGGIDLNNPFLNAMISQQSGVPYYSMGVESALNPNFASLRPVLAERSAVDLLHSFGFTGDMDKQDVLEQFKSIAGDQTGVMLAPFGAVNAKIASNPSLAAEDIMARLGHPVEREAAAMAAQAGAHDLPTGDVLINQHTGKPFMGDKGDLEELGGGQWRDPNGDLYYNSEEPFNAKTYVEEGLGVEVTGGGIFNQFEHDNPWADIARTEEARIQRTGKTYGVVDAILGDTMHGVNTFVKTPEGKYEEFAKFQQEHKNYGELLADPESGYLTATATAQEMEQIEDTAPGSEGFRKRASTLDWQTAVEAAAGNDNPNNVHSVGSEGEMDLGERTIRRLIDGFREAVEN